MKKILVIEDDSAIQEVITDVLENEGYKVFVANNGKSGVAMALEIKPDLIICDIMMPKLNGYEVFNILSKESYSHVTPFIFLTAKVEKDDISKGMELGADDYLLKPFKIDELLKRVQARIKRYEQFASKYDDTSKIESKKLSENDQIIVEINGKPEFLKISEIVYLSSLNEYTKIFTISNKSILLRRLLKEWTEILPGNIFIRIHRGTIIKS